MDVTCVRCPAGNVTGWYDGAVLRATGIRYARAERHEAPEAEPERDGDIDATHFSPRCPQRANQPQLRMPGCEPSPRDDFLSDGREQT